MRDRPLLSVLVVTLVVVGAAGLVAIAAPVGAQTTGDPGANGSAADGSGANATTDGSVSVTAGAQLSTVLSVTSDDVHAEVEETAFEVEYERGEGRAEAVAERAEAVRERAEAVRENYREALEAYREGDLDRSEFARRLAALNARAGNVIEAYDRLERRAANVSAFDLRAAGLNRTALERAVTSLDDVRGTGAGALLAQFTGERRGEVELEVNGGLSIEVSSEGGERSREFEREPDGDTAVTVNQSAALETARAALTDVGNGSWVLTDASIDSEDGTYEFEFVLRAGGLTGEAEVGIDGSSGEVFNLEEETEPADGGAGEPDDGEEERESDEDDEEGDGDDDREDREFEELSLLVADGQPGPNETVTVRVLADGRAVANASVAVDGEAVGETGDDGTLALTLPAAGDVTVTAVAGGEEATLDVGLGDDRALEAEFERNFAFSATLEDGTVSVRAAYGGDGIPDATVYADGEAVGRTDADGSLRFDVGDVGDDLELDLVKGAFEAEYEFAVENGSLTLTDREYDRDGDRPDADREERDGEDDSGDDGPDDDSDSNDGTDDADDDGTDAGSDDEEDDSDSDDGDEEDDSDDGEDGDDSNDDEDDGDDDDGNGDDENDDSER